MLSFKAFDKNGQKTESHTPLSLTLKREEDVPADIIEFTAAGANLPILRSVEVYLNENLVFCGEVDEQIKTFGETPQTQIVARSSASLLIDSEAYPMSFANPSAEDIYSRYAKPFGFILSGENKELGGRFTVSKGTSCFSVIKKFSAEVYGAFPRCEGNVLYIDGIKNNRSFMLGEGGIPFESLKTVDLRCEKVSRVYLRLKDGEGYRNFVSNIDAEKEGVNKVRYLNVASTSASTLKDADRILSDAKRKSFYAEAVCKGYLGDSLGASIKVSGLKEELYVSAIRYTFSKNGEHTKLTLKRKEK